MQKLEQKTENMRPEGEKTEKILLQGAFFPFFAPADLFGAGTSRWTRCPNDIVGGEVTAGEVSGEGSGGAPVRPHRPLSDPSAPIRPHPSHIQPHRPLSSFKECSEEIKRSNFRFLGSQSPFHLREILGFPAPIGLRGPIPATPSPPPIGGPPHWGMCCGCSIGHHWSMCCG